jgi:hypothetical protein
VNQQDSGGLMSSSGPTTDPLRCAPTITLWMAPGLRAYRLSNAFKRAFFGLITTWLVKRVLQQHVWRSEFIHDIQVAGLAPKISKPATYDRLVLTSFDM